MDSEYLDADLNMPRWLRRELKGNATPGEIHKHEMEMDYKMNYAQVLMRDYLYDRLNADTIYEGFNPHYSITLTCDQNRYILSMFESVSQFCDALGYPGDNMVELSAPMELDEIIDFTTFTKKRMELAFLDSKQFRDDRHEILRGRKDLYLLNEEQNAVLAAFAKMTGHYRYTHIVDDIRQAIQSGGIKDYIMLLHETDEINDDEYYEYVNIPGMTDEALALIMILIEPCADYENKLHEARKSYLRITQ